MTELGDTHCQRVISAMWRGFDNNFLKISNRGRLGKYLAQVER